MLKNKRSRMVDSVVFVSILVSSGFIFMMLTNFTMSLLYKEQTITDVDISMDKELNSIKSSDYTTGIIVALNLHTKEFEVQKPKGNSFKESRTVASVDHIHNNKVKHLNDVTINIVDDDQKDNTPILKYIVVDNDFMVKYNTSKELHNPQIYMTVDELTDLLQKNVMSNINFKDDINIINK